MKYTSKDGFPYYFNLAGDEDLRTLFSSSSNLTFLKSINEEMAVHRYAPDKWSIKQVVGHITDHERIKMFRAFQLSRNVTVQLWGYDQEALVRNGRFDELSMQLLLTDYANVRKSSLSFIHTLSEFQLKIKGMAQHYEITLEQFLKSIFGHEIHHINILKDRYL